MRITVFAVCATVLLVALIALVLDWAPHWLASTNGLNASQRADEVGRVRTALLALLLGGVAVYGAIYTGRTFALNRQGQITERFTRAVDQLGSEKLDVRMGGIYALERLARESQDDHPPIVEILSAYVREHAPWPPQAPAAIPETPASTSGPHDPGERPAPLGSLKPASDVQAALTVLGRRNVSHDTSRTIVELQQTALMGAVFASGDWRRALLFEANLEIAVLVEANLEGAILYGTNLKGAILRAANLAGTMLDAANLEWAMLNEAHLEDTRLHGAKLTGASLDGATLTGAQYDPDTQWPDGFEPAAHGAVLTERWSAWRVLREADP